MEEVYFAKVKEDAVIPSKRDEDGAYDVYACFDEGFKVINPHATELIPTGIASCFSSRYAGVFKERGSSGTVGMGQRAGLVDSGYRGEWFCPVTNHNERPIVIIKKELMENEVERNALLSKVLNLRGGYIVYPYEKAICQCLFVEVPKLTVKEISFDELKTMSSLRGEGALGSSGK